MPVVDVELDLQEPADPDPVPDDQVSMVLDHPDLSESVTQVIVIDDEVVQQEAPAPEEVQEPDNALAIVPYQPLPVPLNNDHLGLLRIVAGPVLPPAMIWQRTFASLLQEIYAMDVPRTLHFLPVLPIVCSKRSWQISFDE